MAGEDEVIIKFKADTTDLSNQLDKAAGGVKLNIDKKSIDQATASVNKLGASTAKALQTKNIKEVSAAFKQADKEIKQTAATMDKVVKTSTSLKSQLKQLKAELSGLEEGSLEFNRVAKAAGELEDKIGDINQRVKALASDTGKIDALVDAATGLAGGFAAAQGAAALLGGENEDLQKSFVKVQSAMAILQGVQALANTLNKDSAFSTIFLSKAQNAAASSTSFLGKAFGKLSLALLNNPVTAVVVGLVAAVVAIKAFAGGTSQAEKDQQALNSAMDDAQAAADNYVNALQEVIDKIRQRYDIEKRLAEANGKDILDITRREFDEVEKLIKSKQDDAVKAREIYTGKIVNLEQELAAKELEIENEKNAIKDAIIKQNNLNVLNDEREALRQRLVSNQAALSELGDLERQAAKTIKDNQTELTIIEAEELKKRLDAQREKYKQQLDLEKGFRKQLEDLRVKNIADETEEAIAAENLRFQRLKEETNQIKVDIKLRNDLLEELEQEHQDNLFEIRKKAEQKKAEQYGESYEIQKVEGQKRIELNQNIDSRMTSESEEDRKKREENEALYNEEMIGLAQDYYNAFLSISNSLALLGHESAELQKALALFQIAMDTGKAVSSAIAGAVQAASLTGPAAPFIVGAYIATALSAVFAGIAQAKTAVEGAPVPQFAKGVEYLNGAGTETSDSIPARLSKGERVVTADKNRKYWDELSAIHNGNYERLIQEKYVMPALQQAVMDSNNIKDQRLATSIATSLYNAYKGENIEFGLERNRRSAKKDTDRIVSALKTTRQNRRKY